MKNSESIKMFLDFVDECQNLNNTARENISVEEKTQQDLTHQIEFERYGKKR